MDDILDRYKYNPKLRKFNLIHIYPKELTKENGIVNSRFFEVIGFNTVKMQKVSLGRHDNVHVWDIFGTLPLSDIQVFRDKSVVLVFKPSISTVEKLSNTTQTLYLTKGEKE